MTLDSLATNYLSVCLNAPVVNMTGLTAEYKIDLNWEGEGYPLNDPAFLETVEKQMGLQVEKRTMPFNVLVIDHVARSPSAD